jgi:hypothetical protein
MRWYCEIEQFNYRMVLRDSAVYSSPELCQESLNM